MTSDTAVLESCSFFEHFQPKHIEKLSTMGTRVQFETGQIIFREDDDSTLFYVILSGRVALEASLGGGNFRIQTLYAGDELGWSAVLHRKKQFQARALEPVQALAFEAAALHDACERNPYFGRDFQARLLTLLAERLQSTRLQLLAVLGASGPPAPADPVH